MEERETQRQSAVGGMITHFHCVTRVSREETESVPVLQQVLDPATLSIILLTQTQKHRNYRGKGVVSKKSESIAIYLFIF